MKNDDEFNAPGALKAFNEKADLFDDADPGNALWELAFAQKYLGTLIRFTDVKDMTLKNTYLVAECDGPGNFRIFGDGMGIRKTTFDDISDAEWANFHPLFNQVWRRYAFQTRHMILDTAPVAVIYLDPRSYRLIQESVSGFSSDGLPSMKLVSH